jgi:hypothetical protein
LAPKSSTSLLTTSAALAHVAERQFLLEELTLNKELYPDVSGRDSKNDDLQIRTADLEPGNNNITMGFGILVELQLQSFLSNVYIRIFINFDSRLR